MIRFRILLFATLFPSLFWFPANAQRNNGSIWARVFDADGNPAYVTVELKKLGRVTLTDENGYLLLRGLPALKDTLIISSAGSKTYMRAVELQKGATINLGEIHLSFNVGQLQNIEVKGRTLHSYKSDYSFFGNKTETPIKDIPQSISTVTKELIMDKMELT